MSEQLAFLAFDVHIFIDTRTCRFAFNIHIQHYISITNNSLSLIAPISIKPCIKSM